VQNHNQSVTGECDVNLSGKMAGSQLLLNTGDFCQLFHTIAIFDAHGSPLVSKKSAQKKPTQNHWSVLASAYLLFGLLATQTAFYLVIRMKQKSCCRNTCFVGEVYAMADRSQWTMFRKSTLLFAEIGFSV
jgi:hypothetical protein